MLHKKFIKKYDKKVRYANDKIDICQNLNKYKFNIIYTL